MDEQPLRASVEAALPGTLAAARGYLDRLARRVTLDPDLSARLDWIYDEFPELELGYPRATLGADAPAAASNVSVTHVRAAFARARLERAAFRHAASGSGEKLLILAERIAAKLPVPAVSPPPSEIPARFGWPNRPRGFAEVRALRKDGSAAEAEWLPHMSLGDAGERRDGQVRGRHRQAGHIVYGPYFDLPAGAYQVQVDIETLRMPWWARRTRRMMIVEVVSGAGAAYLAKQVFTKADLRGTRLELPFAVEPATAGTLEKDVEIRIWTSGLAVVTIRSVKVVRV